MVPLYICDDEQAQRERIAGLVQKQIMILDCDIGPVRTFGSAAALLAAHDGEAVPAVYLLDVDLQDHLDGFGLAVELRRRDPRGYIIFITGHGELSFETFRYRLEAMDYIVKGGDGEMQARLQSCLGSIVERLRDERGENSRYYTIKLFDTIRHIPLSRLLYFEANGRQHRISLHTDNEVVEFFGSLQPVEEDLCDDFFRCHRSCLVNRRRIRHIRLKEQEVELDNGERLPLSRGAKKLLQQSL